MLNMDSSASNNENDLIASQSTTIRLRDPYNTHMGDSSSTGPMITRSSCPIISYHQPSQAFLDLVELGSPHDGQSRLRIRVGARVALPTDQLTSAALNRCLPYEERIRHLYADGGANRITYWPPEVEDGHVLASDTCELIAELGRLMSPPTHVGACEGMWDERSLVYSTGNNADGLQAIIYVGFDPTVALAGLRRWTNRSRRSPQTNSEHACAAAAGDRAPVTQKHGTDGFSAGVDNGKGKGIAEARKAIATTTAFRDLDDEIAYSRSSSESIIQAEPPDGRGSLMEKQQGASVSCVWSWTEPAMYRGINFGYNHLPDFTRAREDWERRKKQATAVSS